MAAHRRHIRWISLIVLAWASSTSASPPTSVVDVLRALAASGVEVLFSSDLVPPNLAAPVTLRSADPMFRAVETLSAHHLLLRKVGERSYIVTRGSRPPGAASEPSPTLRPARTVAELEEVSVSASRYALTANAIGEPSQITRDDMEAVPGAEQDALRAVRQAPGIATNLSSRPYVRGASFGDVLVRFDGIALTDPFHFKNFQNLISAFEPAAVQRIDVYTGGFPVKYGTKSAGVIDMAPRSLQSGYENRIGVSRLSYDLSAVGHADHAPIDWLATVRHSVHDIALKPINGDIGEPTFIDALGRIRWQADDASAWTFGWLLLDDRVRLATDPPTEQAAVHDRDQHFWVASDWAASGALHSRTSFASTNMQRTRSGSVKLAHIANGQLDEQRDFTAIELRSDWIYVQSAETTWNFGAEAARQRAELYLARTEQFGLPVTAGSLQALGVSLLARRNPRSSVLGLFASGRHSWQHFEAEAGVRLDGQDHRGFGTHAQLSPRINLRLDPAPQWHAYGSWGSFIQSQRDSEWRTEENQSAPDPASRATHLVAGVARDGAVGSQWRIEMYRNQWSSVSPYYDNALDSLSLLPDIRPDRVRIAPRGAETAGVELSARQSLGHGFDALASYALSRTTDDLNGRDVPRSWDQAHDVKFNLSWRHANTSASLLVGWHSGWPRTPAHIVASPSNEAPSVALGARNSVRWGNYSSTDLHLAQTLPNGHGALTLWMDTNNIFNRRNECCTVVVPADSAGATSAVTTSYWLSRVVNIGFTWQFGGAPSGSVATAPGAVDGFPR